MAASAFHRISRALDLFLKRIYTYLHAIIIIIILLCYTILPYYYYYYDDVVVLKTVKNVCNGPWENSVVYRRASRTITINSLYVYTYT
jgi:hypothetical protein